MTDLIGTALVEILPDTSQFDTALQGPVEDSANQAADAAAAAINDGRISDAISEAGIEGGSALSDSLAASGAEAGDALAEGVLDGADSLSSSLGETGDEAGSALAEGVISATDGLSSALGDAGGEAGEALSGSFETGVGDLSAVVEGSVDGAEAALEGVGEAAGEAASDTNAAFAEVDTGGLLDRIDAVDVALFGVGIAAATMAEGFARGQADTTAALQRVSISIGETDDDVRDMIDSLVSWNFAFDDAATAAEDLVRRGISELDEIERILPLMDQFADATGVTATDAVGLLDTTLRAVGLSIGDAGEHLDTFTFLLSETPVTLEELGRAVGRAAPQIQEMNLGLDGAVAGLGLLIEQGVRPRDAIRDFGTAAEESGGDIDVFLEKLGFTRAEFDAFVGRIDTATGRTDAFAEANNNTITPLERVQVTVQNLATRFGDLAPALSAAALPLALAGPMITGVRALGGLLPALATRLGTVATALTGPWGLALAGAVTAIGFFVTRSDDAEEATQRWSDTLDEFEGSVSRATSAIVDRFLDANRDIVGVLNDLGVSQGDLTRALTGTDEEAAALTETLRDQLEPLGALDSTTGALTETNDDAILSLIGLVEGHRAAVVAEQEHTESVETFNAAATGAITVTGNYFDALRVGESSVGNLLQTTDDYTDRLRDNLIAQGLVDEATGEAVFVYEDAASRMRDSIISAYEDGVTAIQNYADELRLLTDPIFAAQSASDEAAAAQEAYNEALDEFGEGAPEVTDAANNLIQARQDENAALLAITEEGGASYLAQIEQMVIDGDLTRESANDLRDEWNLMNEDAAGVAATIDSQLTPSLSSADAMERVLAEHTNEVLRPALEAIDRTFNVGIVEEGGEGVNTFVRSELLPALEGVDATWTANIEADTGSAISKITDVATRLANLVASVFTVRVNTIATGGALSRDMGGEIVPGQLYFSGVPELFVTQQPGMAIPMSQAAVARMLEGLTTAAGTGGDVTINMGAGAVQVTNPQSAIDIEGAVVSGLYKVIEAMDRR